VSVKENLENIRSKIRDLGFNLGDLTIVGVSKLQSVDKINEAASAGLLDFGENYAQEFLKKYPLISFPIRWHFLGELQSNKVKKLAGRIFLFQSLSTQKQAESLSKYGPADVLIELNPLRDPAKKGCFVEHADQLISQSTSFGFKVKGVMALGVANDCQKTAEIFRKTKKFADASGLEIVSMGMSGDYEIALAEGSNMIRIGELIFGKRPMPEESRLS
jgi:pyridoxal phosphate enzyme (YggS family)